MTNFMITVKLDDLIPLDYDPETANRMAVSFCQCIHNLVRTGPDDYKIKISGNWATAVYVNVDDDVFQSIEEVIGQTLWDLRVIEQEGGGELKI